MEVRNCKGCGRLFNVISNGRLCPACVNQLEDKFQEVKKYLNENPNSNIDVLSKECDVSVKQLKEWVRQERLTFSEGSADGVECESCGAMIRTGRFCDACKSKLTNELKSAVYVEKPEERKKKLSDKDRMRFLQNL